VTEHLYDHDLLLNHQIPDHGQVFYLSLLNLQQVLMCGVSFLQFFNSDQVIYLFDHTGDLRCKLMFNGSIDLA